MGKVLSFCLNKSTLADEECGKMIMILLPDVHRNILQFIHGPIYTCGVYLYSHIIIRSFRHVFERSRNVNPHQNNRYSGGGELASAEQLVCLVS